MIRLYRQTPEGIERTTQVDAAEQNLDSVFWIDLLTPEPAEIKFVERLCGLEMPTYDEMREIEATSRLYTEDGARFMTTTVLSRVDTESPSLSEITFVLMGAKIITIRHSDSYSFRVFSHQLLRQKQISRDQVFTGLLETIVDRQADVLAMPMLDSAANNVLLESMACGTPVMVNRVGGVPEYVDAGCNFVTSNDRNVDEWVEKLLWMERNRDAAEQMRPATRSWAERFDWKIVAEQYREMYRRVLARG